MKLTNENISLQTTENGEISSIVFKEKEMLHEGKQFWQKTYPMIWPVTSFSRAFEVDGESYELPKHGFWNKLEWEQIYEADGSLTLLATHIADNVYPFTIDIQNNIKLEGNEIFISTKFQNLSKKTAHFNFGHHPAFKIDEESELEFSKLVRPLFFGLKAEMAPFGRLMEMPFGVNYDTIIFHNAKGLEVSFNYTGTQVKVSSMDFDTTQIWKPKDADFVCIEPWQGYNDDEYDYPTEASKKLETISLNSGEEIVKSIKFSFK